MGGKSDTVTRATLAEAVYRELGLSRTESAALVDSLIETICDSLVREGTVKIASFGSFVVRTSGPRVGRNPRTGEVVPIAPRRTAVFRPSRLLRDRLNRAPVTAPEDDAG